MVEFDKYHGLSAKGWTKHTATQVLAPGESALIGLKESVRPDEVLKVVPVDPSICVVHEEPQPKSHPGWRLFVITALAPGDTRVVVLTPEALINVTEMNVKVVGKTGIRLVFFPGERKKSGAILGAIYVVGGKGESFPAAGGGRETVKDEGGHTYEPTPAGHYTLGPRIHVVAPSWPTSVIPWGAELRLNDAGEVEYKSEGSHTWRLATGPRGAVTLASIGFDLRSGNKPDLQETIDDVRTWFIRQSSGELRSDTWKKNDFGKWGWNLRQGGQNTAFFVHTTPANEKNVDKKEKVKLENSHGCIHISPIDRETMIDAGYLKEGVPFEVRSYDEKGPPK